MKISQKRITAIRAKSPKLGFNPRAISLRYRLQASQKIVRKDIEENHSAALLLLEEALSAVLSYEAYLHDTYSGTGETIPFKFALSRVRADLVSIYHLLSLGQESSALALARIFIENIQLLMAVAISHEFSREYHSAETNDKFWEKRIGYGRINPFVEEFIFRGSNSHSLAKNQIEQHKRLKNFLSGYVHPTMSSAIRVVLPPAVDTPGHFLNRPLGWFGINSARLCIYLADEIQTLLVCCINLFIRPDSPAALADHYPDKALATFFVHAHTLQHLSRNFAHKIESDYEKRSSTWEEAAFGQDET